MGYRYLVGPDVCVDPADRGLAYGDGLFETMLVRDGQVQRFQLHLDRLTLGCERLQLPVPVATELESRARDCATGYGHAVLKLILSRGVGPRGYAPPAEPEPVIMLSIANAAPVSPDGLRVITLAQRLGENEQLAGIKHLCRLEQVLGQLELSTRDADEGLMLSSSESVIGGTSRNLFACFGQRLLTPDLTRAGIAGTMRRHVLEHASQLDLEVSVSTISAKELAGADEIFMTNAVAGIQSVASLDGHQFARTNVAGQLRQILGLSG